MLVVGGDELTVGIVVVFVDVTGTIGDCVVVVVMVDE